MSEPEQCFVEMFEATVMAILPSGTYVVLIERLRQQVEILLPRERHGSLKCADLIHTFYKPSELKANLSEPSQVRLDDKVRIHFSRDNTVMRWEKCFEEAIQQRA